MLTKSGFLTFYFESPEILHITSSGPGVLLSGNLDHNNTIPAPGSSRTWKLKSGKFVVTIRSGHGEFEETDQKGRFLIMPQDNQLDIVIEQYPTDWLPRTYTESYQTSMDNLKKELRAWLPILTGFA